MATSYQNPNPLNIFTGPDSLSKYFDPEQNPPLPLVELPEALNPYRKDGVRIYAKMLTALPAQNVKSLPALEMLKTSPKARTAKRIVEASSGSTVLSMGVIGRALWGHEGVEAWVTNKKTRESLRVLRFFGVGVSLYGGLAQQEPSDPKGIMSRLRQKASSDPDVCYLGQYDNDANWQSHHAHTGPQLALQLPHLSVLCSTIGTGGCITGTGKYLKSHLSPSIRVIGVCNVFGDPTPGPRHFPGFESSPFPWRETIAEFVSVKSEDAFRMSMRLSRYGIICGPSSGEALYGLLEWLGQEKERGNGGWEGLKKDGNGEVNAVFLCADLPYQYMELYYQKLGEGEFPEIRNQCLLEVDQDPYDERWFLTPEQTVEMLVGEKGEKYGHDREMLCMVPSSCACTGPGLTASRQQQHQPVEGMFGDCSPGAVSDISESASTIFSTASPSSSVYSVATTASVESQSPVTSWASRVKVIDVRPRAEFVKSHLRNAVNIPLSATQEDFYGDPEAVCERWKEMNGAFKEAGLLEHKEDDDERKTVVVCLDGDSGKMAASMLRGASKKAGRQREVFCADGGWGLLESWLRRRGYGENVWDGVD
ncbi:tryptophan synthase beta subunit-like PLP-dependent enzyme [Apiosordaria backusii]|uniref:Tryptophan synthase beta subunit-like PLP-dependent enzyme n=1 Tax=Apiosordaria backusii TaxID=314023 RepID=A0AA40DIP3_9PEZI|nr:tryptophan synthase beta subunit-like PLP-dependent enzyme [Apiosordaria backusii]